MLFTQFIKEREYKANFDRSGNFISDNGLIMMEVVKIHANPNMDQDYWAKEANHYECTLFNKETKKEATFFYSQGSGIKDKKPKLIDVLYCLISDAQGIEGRNFDEWCSDYGHSNDSKKAEKAYNDILENTRKLKEVLGDLWTEAINTEMDY